MNKYIFLGIIILLLLSIGIYLLIDEEMTDNQKQKFYEENTLLGQKFVVDPSISVAEYIDKVSNDYKCDISINKFVRYEIGS